MSDHTSGISRPASPAIDVPPTTRSYRFNWDLTTPRRAGPGSVSETTEGAHVDYFAARPPLGLLNTSATSLPLGALPPDWSSSKHGFHAISTVLNNPHKRQAPPKAHSSLPAVAPADLPRVRRKDFDSYLSAVAPEWSRFESNSQTARDNVAQLDENFFFSQDPFSPTTPGTSHVTGLPPPEKPPPPLDSVPSIFFDRRFNLGDPVTFDIVTEQDPDSGFAVDPSSLSHSLPLLEKFSHYADTIEQHLVREISLRSTSFFAALTNLRDLQSESEQCLDRIGRLRTLLKDVDEKSAKRGLELVRKETKLRNLGAMKEGLKTIGAVVEMTGVARTLISAGQWSEALGVIDELESQWEARSDSPTAACEMGVPSNLRALEEDSRSVSSVSQHDAESRIPQPALPLSSLQAFAALPAHIRDLTTVIATSLTSEVVNILRHDLVERLNRENETTPTSEGNSEVNQPVADRLRPLLHGLIRTKGLNETTLSWREVVLDEVRNVMKRRLPSLGDNATVGLRGQDSGVSAHLQSISHAEFLSLIRGVYSSLLNCLEGLQVQSNILIHIVSSFQCHDPPDIPSLQEELSDILLSAAELSNTRAAAVISMRSEQHAQLDLSEFLSLFNESWNFVVRCEVLCRRMIVSLRGVIVGQAKVFLQHFHQERISRSAKLVEDEQWSPSEVSVELQAAVDVVIDSAVRDPPSLVIALTPSNPLEAPPNGSVSDSQRGTSPPISPSAPPAKSNGTAGSKHLRIEDRTYFTVSATSAVLYLLSDYLQFIVNLSMLTTDTMSKVIEFLKAFNSRTCQVVLGAGAMRSAGLKNITAKHLALASQSLTIMIVLIPYVRETFRRHLSSTQAVMLVEFDKLKRDYQEHQNEIHAKLIAIMGDRLSNHIQSFQAIKWDAPKAEGVNGYMELLVKETVTLHKVLSRYLAASVVEFVMTQVYAAINHRLSEEFTRLELPSQEAKDRLLADARYLHQKLSGLKDIVTPGSMLETIAAEKNVARHSAVSASPTPPSKNSVITANQKLKERLASSLKSQGSLIEKVSPVAPTPVPEPTSPLGAVLNGHGDQATAAATPEDGNLGFKQADPAGVALSLEEAS